MESFDGCSAVSEAGALCRMLGAGSTIEELRELIAVPPRIERALRAFARPQHFCEPTLLHFLNLERLRVSSQ